MSTTEASPNRITIGTPDTPVRFSYVRFHEPKTSTDKQGKPRGEPKFGGMIIVDKTLADGKTANPDVAKINDAMRAAGLAKFPASKFATLKNVLRDGDDPKEEEKGEHLKGKFFFNCTSKNKPGVAGTERDIDGKLIKLGKDEIKSGDYGRVTINFYGYEEEGSKGVAAGLGNVQKTRDGDPLGSQRSVDDDFDDEIL